MAPSTSEPHESRWRPISADGTTIGKPEPEEPMSEPDTADEGETGPAEAVLCADLNCGIQVKHFAHEE